MTAPAAGHGRDGRALVRGVDYVPDSFDRRDDEDLGDEEVLSARVEGDEKVVVNIRLKCVLVFYFVMSDC
jgi:hypothetical protein